MEKVSREILENAVWDFTPKDYKSLIKSERYILTLGSLSPLSLLSNEELTKNYELAKHWTNDFISHVNFQYTHFKDRCYYDQGKDLFEKLKKLLQKNNHYHPVEAQLTFDPVSKEEQTEIIQNKPEETPAKVKEIRKGNLRPEFMDSPMLFGREIEILIPNGEKRNGQFAVVELDQIIASHNENTFSSSEGYPVNEDGNNVNDRNYQDDPNAQAKVIEVAQNLEPSILVTTSRTPAGTPIISTDGFVVSGNNRTMSLKLALKNYPEKYEEYKKLLVQEAESFGISNSTMTAIVIGDKIIDERKPDKLFNERTNEDYIKITNPVLVRFDYGFPEYTTIELSKYNKDTKKSERPIDRAIKLSSILNGNEKLRDAICHIVGEYETLSDFYANIKDEKKLAQILIDGNILTDQERASYYSESGFNEAGKDLIESILASIVLKKEALIASEMTGVKRLRGIIITSLPVLVKNASLPEGRLSEEINEAIVLEKKIHSSGLSFNDYISQGNLFEELPDRKIFFVNRLLNSGRNNFKKSIEAYNASVLDNQGESLFGAKPSLKEIFRVHIENKIDQKESDLIDQFGRPEEARKLSEDKTNDNQPFFEDHTSDLFLKEVKKFNSLKEFKNKYRELNKWIDAKDTARLGMIRIQDTNLYPTKTYVDYSKNSNDFPFFQKLIGYVKSERAISPIIAEQSIFNDGRRGYTVRDGIHRLSAYEHAGLEFIPAIVYETKTDALTRDFDNPDGISLEDFLQINLEEIYNQAVKLPFNPKGEQGKVKTGNYKGFDNTVDNVLIPTAVREPFASHYISTEEMKNAFKKGEFKDLLVLKKKDLPDLSAAQMYELMQLTHPDDYKISIDRFSLLEEWEKRGESIFNDLGFPTDEDYPYVNKHTGYGSVDRLGQILGEEYRKEDSWWWSAAEHNLPVADMQKALQIIKDEINTWKKETKPLLNPATGKVKGKAKSQMNSIDYKIKQLKESEATILNYINKNPKHSKHEKNIDLKAKKAKAQMQRLRLLKKKNQLQKHK